MKKIIFMLIMVFGLLIPLKAIAAPNVDDYKTLGLLDSLKEENTNFPDDPIKISFDKEIDNNDQITIYLFRGLGCPRCHELLEYLNSIYPTYGKYFKVVSFEVWYDDKNNALLGQVASFLDYSESQLGVPLMIIGDQSFMGYGETYNDAIINAITTEYGKDKEDRLDVFNSMKKAEENEYQGDKNVSSTSVIIWNAVIILIATAIIVAVTTYNNNKMNDRIDAIYEKLGISLDDEVVKEKVKEVIDDEDYEVKKTIKKENTKKKKN